MFRVRLVLCWALTGAAVVAVLTTAGLARVPGQVLLAVMLAHAVELQHQCLHGTGLATPFRNRWVGRVLGAPMLVSYSHYRVRHLRHHRYLGTSRDSEFFQYRTEDGLSARTLLASAFDVRRYTRFVRTAVTAVRGGAVEPGAADVDAKAIRVDYVLLSLFVVGVVVLSVATRSTIAVVLWLVPLVVFAAPVHFLIELPEHILCDTTTRDPRRNTRTIRGSRFSFWLTNGNNFHVEHHLKQWAPIAELPAIHGEVAEEIEVLVPTYWTFYRQILSMATARRPAEARARARAADEAQAETAVA